MTTPSKDRAFVELMCENPEQEAWGYEMLCKQQQPERFFDLLKAKGLFDPSKNPAPVPTEEPGDLLIPFWPALNYLAACAEIAASNTDLELSKKILGVIREVSRYQNEAGYRDNGYTYWKFAEMMGMLPLRSFVNDDCYELIRGTRMSQVPIVKVISGKSLKGKLQ